MKDLPDRKHPRLKSNVYDQAGMYFITICTKGRSPCLGKIVWDDDKLETACCKLSETGEIVKKHICNIPAVYADTVVDTYMIMPDHVHLLLRFLKDTYSVEKENSKSPSVSTKLIHIICSTKTLVTKDLGYSIWQTSFYDSILPDENAFLRARVYIRHNPARWAMRYGIVPE